MSDTVLQLHQKKFNNALLRASLAGHFKILILLVEAGANNFEHCIRSGQHLNHIVAFLRLCQAVYEDDRTAIQLLLERDESKVSNHPQYPTFLHYRQILMPLVESGKISMATPIRVALKANHIIAAGHILLRLSKHPSSGLVDWHGLDLKFVPGEWLKALEYPNLMFISFSFNKLTQIPSEIKNFKGLIKLQLAYNQISFVPSEIFQLPKIEQIDLSYNMISSLPEALLGQVSRSLSNLNLSNNKLTIFPAYFEGSGIEELDLSHNMLQDFPKSVCMLRRLQSLNVSENLEIKHIPYELGGVKDLKVLSVDGLTFATNIPRKKKASTLGFIQKRFPTIQTVTHYELVVIGFPNHLKPQRKLLDALSVAELNCSFLRYDNALQFLFLHQIFQLPNSLYVVVWDCQNKQDANQLHHVLRHLSLYAPDSPVIVAACWKTLIDSHFELAVEDSISKSLWKDLSSDVLLQHVILGASGVPDETNSVQALTKLIHRVAKGVKSTLFVPESYCASIKFLQKACKQYKADSMPPMLTGWDFWELIRSTPTYDLSGRREIRDLVSVLTSMAVLLQVPCTQRGIQDLYVLDRQWFCELLGHVVSTRVDPMGNFSAIVLQEGLIDLLNCPTLRLPLPDALRVFVSQHGIALALSSQKWFIPSMLYIKPDDMASEFSSQYGIRRQYTFKLTPVTFWSRLITHLLINMESLVQEVFQGERRRMSGGISKSLGGTLPREGVIDWTYWAMGIVCWRNACNLVYSIEAISTISEPFMEGLEIRVPFSTAGCHAMQTLTYTIDSLLSNWYPTIWKSVEIWVPCSYCLHNQSPDIPSISFQDCLLAVSKGVGVKCMQHPEKVVSIGKIVPDLVQEDVSRDCFLSPGSIDFNLHDKSSCISPPPSETIWKGMYSKQLVAVKPFPHPVPNHYKKKSQQKASPFLEAWLELETLRHVEAMHCPYLLDIVGVCPDPLCLVFSFAKWGSLEEVIQMKELTIPHLVRLRMVYQLAVAIEALHSYHVIHRNVCLANILVYSLSADDQVNIKLGGLSEASHCIFQGVSKGFHGSFIPPEMSEQASSEYDERIDIFAFAFVAYEIIIKGTVHVQSQIPLQKLSSSAERPSLLPIATRAPYMVSLLDKCWAADFCKRPFAKEVLCHLKEPLHAVVRDGLAIHDDQEFFAAAALFTRVQNTFHADVFICSGPLSGEGTTCLTHVSLPGLTTKTCTSLPSEYVICMCCVGPQLWVSFYGKKVRVYSTSNLEFMNEFKFTHHVISMAVTPTSVYLGLENGVLKVYDVSDGNVPTDPTMSQVICPGQDFRCIEPLEDCLVCATKNTIFRLHADTLNIEARWPVVSESDIRLVMMTEFGEATDMLWISFRRLERVEVLNAWDGTFRYTVECSKVVNLDASKVWVLTMRVVLDTVWIGLNTGHILVFSATATDACLLTHYKVHQDDVRHLLLLHPSYMGPSSVHDHSPTDSEILQDSFSVHETLPESVLVLSSGQGLAEAFLTLDDDGIVLPAGHQKASKEGLFAVVLEGMSQSRTAGLEKYSGREMIAYMKPEESPYDEPGNEPAYENANPIFRTDTWSAYRSESPILSIKRPVVQGSVELSNSYVTVEEIKTLRPNTVSTSSSESAQPRNSKSGQVPSNVQSAIPPPVPPRNRLKPPPPPPPSDQQDHPLTDKTSMLYDTVEDLIQIPLSTHLTPNGLSSHSARPKSNGNIPRTSAPSSHETDKRWLSVEAPSLVDSCGGEEFEPYIRMNSILKKEPRIPRIVEEKPSDIPTTSQAPPIPPRSPKRR